MPWTVKLQYFKESGKWYASDTYETSKQQMYGIFDEVKAMRDRRELPGLIAGHSPFAVHIECPDHPNGYPGLLPWGDK